MEITSTNISVGELIKLSFNNLFCDIRLVFKVTKKKSPIPHLTVTLYSYDFIGKLLEKMTFNHQRSDQCLGIIFSLIFVTRVLEINYTTTIVCICL